MQQDATKYNEIILSVSRTYNDHNACQHTDNHHRGDTISHSQY